MARKIELSKGMFAWVSDEDYERVSQYKWYASYHGSKMKGRDKWYARRTDQSGKTKMHRFIMGLEAGDKRVVHHINNNGLDNRRENLEIVQDNHANMMKEPGWNKSKTRVVEQVECPECKSLVSFRWTLDVASKVAEEPWL